MGPFVPLNEYTHILVALDYVNKLVEAYQQGVQM
jgi:hypothetical protein